MNNWHRRIWTLNPPGSSAKQYVEVYQGGASNEFWLEPAVYAGSPTTVALIQVSTNALCYRAQFVDQDMLELWRGLEFFPAGDQPLTVNNQGVGQPTVNTERLQANATIQSGPAVISLYPDPASPGQILVEVKLRGGGGGGGWGGGHD